MLINCIGSAEEATLLEEYFKEVSEIVSDEQNKHYAVLLCRRSLVVYEIIRCICNLPKKDHILCNDDLTALALGDNAIIIDDIVIHGRTVCELYNLLKSMGIKVTASAFYKKYNAEFLNDEIIESYNHICGRDVTESEWHDFSNRLITLILKSKIPYTTFTYSYAFEKSYVLKRMEFYDIIDVEQTTMTETDMKMTVFFDKKYKSDFTLLSRLCSCVCIRQYKSSEDYNVICIPFVFIPLLNKDIFYTLGDSFKELSMPSSIINIFVDDMYSMEYKARFLSFLLSYAYGYVTIEKGQVDVQRTEVIKSIIGKSFVNAFEDVLSLSEEHCHKILNLDIKSIDAPQTQVKGADFFTDFNISFQGNYTKFITNIILSLHKENEKRASNKAKSSWGVKLGDVLCALNEDINAIGFLISMWDIGKASLYFKEYGDYVYGCIADGEQAYRIEHQANAPYARSVLLLRSALTKFKALSWDTLLDKYLNYLKNYFPDIDALNEYKESILQCNEFFQNKAITSLNASGCSFEFGDKLYERTQAFLQNLNENDEKMC